MSAVVRTKRTKPKPISTIALWVVLGLAAAFFLVQYGHEVLLEHSLRDQAAAQRQSNAVVRDENNRLKALLQYYKSDSYIEQRAREDLNLRRRDELVVIPVAGTPVAQAGTAGIPGAANASGDASATPVTAAEPNWQKWLDLFAPSP